MSSSLSTAFAAFRGGQLKAAEEACRQVLATDPTNAGAWNLLGVIAGTTGAHAAAARHMREAVRLAPEVVEYSKNLARALLHQGELDEAESTLRRGLEREPGAPDLLALWGAVSGQRGNLEEGIEALEKAIRERPRVALYHFNLAELYRRRRDRGSAIACLQRTLELDPRHAHAWNNLAGLQLSQGDFMEALRTIQRLLEISPRSAQAYCNLGILMGVAGDSHAAALALRNAMALDPESPRARFQLASMLIGDGQLDEADRLMRELRAAEASDPISYKTTHARILERKGDLRAAAEILDTIDEEQQLHPEVAIIRAILQEQQGAVEDAIKTLEAVLQSDDVAAIDGIGIHFLLGQCYDSRGRYEEAFAAYQRGNENRKKAFVKFDRPREPGAEATDRLIALYERQAWQECPTSSLDSRVPIFIVGMPRSGTSLAEQILACHAEVYGGGELTEMRDLVRETYETEQQPSSPLEIIDSDPSVDRRCMVPKDWESITADKLTELGSKYLACVQGIGGEAARVTDKMPYNYYLVPLIHKVFPQGKIIHCRRHPLDTCISCYFQNFTGGSRYAFDLVELGAFYRNYLRIMAHWRDELEVPMLELDYEELVSNPEPNVRNMLAYCGLDWDPNCLNFHKSKRVVNTASYQQVRQPIYTRSAGRWQNYERYLKPLIDALGSDAGGVK